MSAPVLRFAVLGMPIAHSKSPVMHAAAYRALGLPHVYERLETSEAELPARIESLRDGTYAGFNVTIPHKKRVLDLVDEVDPSAASIAAANTLVRVGGASPYRIRAHNTDVPALAGELVRLSGRASFGGDTAIVLGSGGAARAAVAALASLGAPRIVVRSRPLTEDARLALLRAGGEAVELASLAPDPAIEASARAVVQATSCGMLGGPPGDVVERAVAWASLPPDAVVLDVVYGTPTPLLEAARARGLRCDDGLGMLAAQGALAFALWLGVPPPTDIMRAALRSRGGR